MFTEKGGCEYAWLRILLMFDKAEKEKKWKKKGKKIDGDGEEVCWGD